MNVSVTPQLEEFVRQKVNSGLYGSASEVVREALRLLQERDRSYNSKLETLRADLELGRRQLAAGQGKVFDRRAAEQIKAEARRRASKRLKKRA